MSRLSLQRRWPHLALLALAGAADLLPLPWAGRAAASSLGGLMLALLAAETGRRLRRVLSRSGRTQAGAAPILRARLAELCLVLGAGALLGTKIALWAQGGFAGPGGPLDAVYAQYAVGFLVLVALRLTATQLRFQQLLHRLDFEPAQTVAVGFAAAILAGGLVLSLPFSVTELERLSMLDALFMATSAVTVTGLSVYDIPSHLTPFGKGVLLLLVQIGGIGTMSATASMVLLAGRRMRLKQAAALQETMDVETVGQVRTLLQTVLVTTLSIEALGTALLWLALRGVEGGEGLFFALFHAVSAFCNAGFSLFSANLVPVADRVGVNAVVAGLIVTGGLGFPVLRELYLCARARRFARLSLHARIVLVVSAALLVAGFVGLALLEWGRSFGPLAWPARLLAAAFHSVAARSGGFNTVDVGAMAPASLFLLMALMFVGGSPGGTAGGVKTTTAATILLTLRAVLRGRERVEACRRTLPDEQVRKALALIGVSALTLVAASAALLVVEPGAPLPILFEAVSAFATTGLSANLTPRLSPGGKVIVMLLMFVGRTGPLTLAFAIAARSQRARVVYPEEKIMLG